jgi:hypothetical protein
MRFRVYKCDLIHSDARGYYLGNIHDEKYHTDTGKEFTAHPADDVAQAMFTQIYGFNGKFVAGWHVQWKDGEEFIAGHINQHWYIRRVT